MNAKSCIMLREKVPQITKYVYLVNLMILWLCPIWPVPITCTFTHFISWYERSISLFFDISNSVGPFANAAMPIAHVVPVIITNLKCRYQVYMYWLAPVFFSSNSSRDRLLICTEDRNGKESGLNSGKHWKSVFHDGKSLWYILSMSLRLIGSFPKGVLNVQNFCDVSDYSKVRF